jgi:hypothetical protein
VNEHIAATCVRLNKAIALGCVEPLNNSGRHCGTLSHVWPLRMLTATVTVRYPAQHSAS